MPLLRQQQDGIQQALDYAPILDIPCVFSSNGDGFLFHARTANDESIEQELSLENIPSPEELWEKYKKIKGIENQGKCMKIKMSKFPYVWKWKDKYRNIFSSYRPLDKK